MTGGCRQKDWDTSKGRLGDTHIKGQKGKGRDGEQDSVIERDGGSTLQGHRKAEVLGRGKNVRERQVRVGSRREVENKKIAMGRRTEIQRIKNYFQAAGQRDRARGKKKPHGEGRVTHSKTLRE